ncbi:hypothetical protein ACFOY4_24230 [Actinomadura syzygii]|uniref:Uncharacterized protein n=1 Tax=Actinomadura syzygii TaxID=1427538 RepID=A0A5D0ULG3_9ACTN|nr:hypothetical protein [Actinomadura syzygii]TYC18463.1 hypothetical protein FXF65_01495 [Actinomadura syzygii]
MLSGRDGPNVTVTAAPAVCDQRSGWIVGDTSAPPPDGALAMRDARKYRRWLDEHGAVPAERSETIVTVNGSGSAAVVIEDIKITVIRRAPPRTGRHMVPKCGGSLPPEKHYAPVALDEFPVGQPASLRQKIGSSSYGKATTRVLGTVPVVKFPFAVTETDYSYVNLVAVADECDCTWKVEVEWLNGERRGIHRPGKTFELSAVAAGSPRSSP